MDLVGDDDRSQRREKNDLHRERDGGSDGERDGGSDGERDGGSERREKKDHDGREEGDDRLNGGISEKWYHEKCISKISPCIYTNKRELLRLHRASTST
ncbi:hypothetical protein YC2023_071284 [Brassica napus]